MAVVVSILAFGTFWICAYIGLKWPDFLVASLIGGITLTLASVGWVFRTLGRQIQRRESLEVLAKELSRHSSEIAGFAQFSEMLQASTTIQELCKVVASFSKELFPKVSGALYTLELPEKTLVPQIRWGSPAPVDLGAFPAQDCWAIRRGKPHYGEDPQREIFCGHLGPGPAPVFSFCLPLAGQEGILGLLHLRAEPLGLPMSELRRPLATSLAYQVALGLSNLKLKEFLREEAIRDPVTGLFNRRYMQETLNREIGKAHRTGKTVGIISLDLDHFKEVNDTLGHAAGDSLLQGLANLARKGLRAEDVACRQGGDELFLILPDISEEDALKLAEDFRVRAIQFMRGQFPLMAVEVTLSAGVAIFPQDGSTPQGLQKAADRALYRAKSLGRNRVIAAKELVRPGST